MESASIAYLCKVVKSNFIHQVGIIGDIALSVSLFSKPILGLDGNACCFVVFHLTDDLLHSEENALFSSCNAWKQASMSTHKNIK